MEFFEGSQEIRNAPVNNAVIDDALRVVRRMWDAGLAHRDIKPSNILVRDDRVLLIDVAFAACRSITVPSQLRSLIRADGRDLIGCFRRLAPAQRSVPVQLWDIRRVAITAGLLAMIAAAVALCGIYLKVAGLL